VSPVYPWRKVVLIIGLLSIRAAVAEISEGTAMGLDKFATTQWAYPAAPSNHGWLFEVREAILVTQLGLLDVGNSNPLTPPTADGFVQDHPIALWREDGTLLATATLSAGTTNPLAGDFRYVPIDPVALAPGERYVIGFHSSLDLVGKKDHMVVGIPSFDVDPAITYLEARYSPLLPTLTMPTLVPDSPTSYLRFGPNFRFVPEPASAWMLIPVAWALRRRRE
jgi:hypothetical protein